MKNITSHKNITRLCLSFIALMAVLISSASPVHAVTTRIKDIVEVEGIRDNMLVGYGLVVGLNGTGDALSNSPFTEQSLIGMLERLGVSVRDQKLNTKNIAAVIITATLPAFANQGSKIDVSISSLGDAKSLQGGTLLVTPLLAADGKVYAVSQGPIAVSGFTASGDGGSVTQNIPTSGRIAAGAIVEREIDFDLNSLKTIRLSLRNPDFTTARRIADKINSFLKAPVASAQNPSSVELIPPASYAGQITDLLTDIEQLSITPDQVARVVIDEKSGIIVMGQGVRISTVAIAQGNLTIRITEKPQVSQPNALSPQGQTVVVPRTDINVDDGGANKFALINEGMSLQDLVENLNSLGIGPRDIISILQSIKTAGALHADIELM